MKIRENTAFFGWCVVRDGKEIIRGEDTIKYWAEAKARAYAIRPGDQMIIWQGCQTWFYYRK